MTHDGLPIVAAIPPIENSTNAGTPDAIQNASFQPMALFRLPPPLSLCVAIGVVPICCITPVRRAVIAPQEYFFPATFSRAFTSLVNRGLRQVAHQLPVRKYYCMPFLLFERG
jgi:hypothetical protein